MFRSLAGNTDVLRLIVAYAAFAISEYAAWIAVLVYAYAQGGATTAGAVAVAQLVPAAGVALLVARVADRSPVTVLVWGFAAQAAGATTTAVLLLTNAPPVWVYAAAILLNGSIPTTRPAQSALAPSITTEVDQLTACNVVLGWAENASILVAGVVTGLLLAVGSAGHVLALTAVLLSAALLCVLPLRRLRRSPAAPADRDHAAAGSLREVWRDRPARILVGLLAAEFVVVGALDLLMVVLAIDLLDVGPGWVGYFNTAYGLGALLLGTLAILLVGRRLALVVFGTALLLGVALASTVLGGLVLVVALLVLVGGSRAIFDVSVRVLLQRSVTPDRLVQVFATAEGMNMLGLAVGSVLVPVLVAIGGPDLALVGTALVLPVLVLVRSRTVVRVDENARVPVVEISLLRQIPLFGVLPGAAIEGLAQSLDHVHLEAGTVLMREGDPGDYYYAVADGTVEVSQRGRVIRSIGRPGGLGEIALLRSVPRTATAVASTPVTAFRLDRDLFLTAVTGHRPTMNSANALVDEHESQDADRWGDA